MSQFTIVFVNFIPPSLFFFLILLFSFHSLVFTNEMFEALVGIRIINDDLLTFSLSVHVCREEKK